MEHALLMLQYQTAFVSGYKVGYQSLELRPRYGVNRSIHRLVCV